MNGGQEGKMDEEKKLTEDEEALLLEFERERNRAKSDMDADIRKELKEQLAEEVKEVMQKEMQGGIEEEVKEALIYSMEAAQDSAPAALASASKEADIRKRIEEEMRLKIQGELEEKIRKEIEEREKLKKEELLKKIQALKKLEEESKMWAEEEKAREEKIRKEIEEKEKHKREELLAKIKELEQKGGPDKKALEEELRESIRKEMEGERVRKKEELMKKLEAVKMPAPTQDGGAVTADEKIILLQLFEESQRIMYSYLTMRLNRKDIETMYNESVETVTDRYPEILKRALYDKNGNQMPGAALNTSRITANVNMLQLPEDKKAGKMIEALRAVFDERLAGIEKKTGNDIKNKMLSDLTAAMKKSITKKGHNAKIESIFMKQLVPSSAARREEL